MLRGGRHQTTHRAGVAHRQSLGNPRIARGCALSEQTGHQDLAPVAIPQFRQLPWIRRKTQLCQRLARKPPSLCLAVCLGRVAGPDPPRGWIFQHVQQPVAEGRLTEIPSTPERLHRLLIDLASVACRTGFKPGDVCPPPATIPGKFERPEKTPGIEPIRPVAPRMTRKTAPAVTGQVALVPSSQPGPRRIGSDNAPGIMSQQITRSPLTASGSGHEKTPSDPGRIASSAPNGPSTPRRAISNHRIREADLRDPRSRYPRFDLGIQPQGHRADGGVGCEMTRRSCGRQQAERGFPIVCRHVVGLEVPT